MNWPLFFSTFGVIFIAELPDKTAFASMLMAARARPFPVFLGACAAFVVQSIVAVMAGSIIGLLPDRIVHVLAGLIFLVLAVFMWRRKQEDEDEEFSNQAPQDFLKTAFAAFVVIFIAEWGDLTQFATATIAAKSHHPWTVFLSATLALWSVTGLAVILGNLAKHSIRPATLQKIAALTFLGVSLFFLITGYAEFQR